MIKKNTPIIVQGITGRTGSYQSLAMRMYGTNVVAGVTPGKRERTADGVPVYPKIKEALRRHKAKWSVLFVPPLHAKDAAYEALDAGLDIVIITEGVPVHDAISIINHAKKRKRRVFGPNCPGFCVVGETKLGIMPNEIFSKGSVGIVSRSGTLTYEVIHQLTQEGIGQSMCVGIGGDPCIGTQFIDVLKVLEKDKSTKQIVLIGEIGGMLEEQAAAYIKKHITKPVVSYISGVSAPPGKTMGHAGAIAGKGSAKEKIQALKDAGVTVVDSPRAIVKRVKELQ